MSLMIDHKNDAPSWYDLRFQIVAVIFAAINNLHMGIGMAFSTIMLPPELLADDFEVDIANVTNSSTVAYKTIRTSSDYLNVTKNQASWIGITYSYRYCSYSQGLEQCVCKTSSLVSLSSIFSSLFCGFLLERFGRKKVLVMGAAINFIGWCVTAASNDDLHFIYAARIFAGIGEGIISSGYVYVSELGHPTFRSSFVAVISGFTALGTVLTSILGFFVTWRGAAIFSAVAGLIGLLGTLILPESPVWIAIHTSDKEKRIEKLSHCSKWSCREPEYFEQFAVKNPQETSEDSDSGATKPFILLLILVSITHLSGCYITIFYACQTFKAAGASAYIAWMFEISIGFIRACGTLICSLTYFNRRSLLITSAAAMTCLSFFIKFWISFNSPSLTSAICVLLQIGFASFGIHPLPFSMTGELLPSKSRGKLTGICFAYQFIIMFILVKVYIRLEGLLGIDNVYLVYGVICLMALVFVYFFIPETQGRTLDEIQESLKRRTIPDVSCRRRKGFSLR